MFLMDDTPLDGLAQDSFLKEVNVVFTKEDNDLLESPPLEEIGKIVRKANHLAAPGTNRIPSLPYHRCFEW